MKYTITWAEQYDLQRELERLDGYLQAISLVSRKDGAESDAIAFLVGEAANVLSRLQKIRPVAETTSSP